MLGGDDDKNLCHDLQGMDVGFPLGELPHQVPRDGPVAIESSLGAMQDESPSVLHQIGCISVPSHLGCIFELDAAVTGPEVCVSIEHCLGF